MNRLDHLIAVARERASHAKNTSNLAQLEAMARQHSPRGFSNKLRTAARLGPAIIAELKRASPSLAEIRSEFLPGPLARELAQAGASALSVLTEEQFFKGSLGDLVTASAVSGLPCLRKDFIVDEVQIIEARAYRADAVLLILASLTNCEFRSLLAMTYALELDALCEVHSEQDLERALTEGVDMIGINCRDLSDFKLNPGAFKLIEKIPATVLAVAESGIATGEQIRVLQDRGFQGFLIGQTLMKARSPGKKLEILLAEAARPRPALMRSWEKGA